MFTTVAYYGSVNPAGADTLLAPVADQTVRISGNDLYVPTLNRLLACAAMIDRSVAASYAKLRSPSLLRLSRYVISPIQGAAAATSFPADPHSIMLNYSGGLFTLAPNEGLDFIINTTPGGAQIQSGVVWLADNAPTPGAAGDIVTIRATSTTAAVAGSWTSQGTPSFDDPLAVGRYSVVGLRAQSTNGLAARLVVPGYAWRPGVLMCNTAQHRDHARFRRGGIGEFCQFDEVNLFTVEVLCAAADAAFYYEIDVVKVS